MKENMKKLVRGRLKLDGVSFEKQINAMEDYLKYASELSEYLEELKNEKIAEINESVVKELRGKNICGAKISSISREKSDSGIAELEWVPPKWAKSLVVKFVLAVEINNKELNEAFGQEPSYLAIRHSLKKKREEIQKIMTDFGWQYSEIYGERKSAFAYCYLPYTNTGYEVNNPEAMAESIKAVIKKISKSKELERIMQ